MSQSLNDAATDDAETRPYFLKPYSNLAGALLCVGCFSAIGMLGVLVGFLVEREFYFVWISLALACLSFTAFFSYTRLEEQYRYEPADRNLFFDRSLFGVQFSKRVASTDEMYCVVASGRPFSRDDHRSSLPGFKYGLTLVLKASQKVELTAAETTSFEDAMSIARDAARRFGIPQLGEERRLMKVVGKHPPSIRFEKHRLEDGPAG